MINRWWFFLVLVSLSLLLADFYHLFAVPKSIIKSPFLYTEANIFRQYQNFQKTLTSFRQSHGAEDQLEERIRQQAVAQNQLSSCLEENEKMRKLLGMPLPRQWDYIDARPLGIVNGRLTIERGSEDGLATGMMVIADGVLVGRVIALERHASSVELINSLNKGIPVVVKKPSGLGVQGRGILLRKDKQLILDRVLQSEDIQKADLVVTSGEEGWLPELIIGQIEELVGTTAEVHKKALVRPLVDYQDLRLVFMVKPN